ncbi:MAG: hypothetical protein GX286_01160 [Clostridiales bacterium]|nr:hypothetical protein [Clostridiales bacterium]
MQIIPKFKFCKMFLGGFKNNPPKKLEHRVTQIVGPKTIFACKNAATNRRMECPYLHFQEVSYGK